MFVVERADFALFLLRSLLLGGALAFVYLLGGFIRLPLASRCKGLPFALALLLPDLCFCLFAAFLNVLMIFAANRGQIRLVSLLFELGGFAFVWRFLGKWIYKAEARLMKFIMKRILRPLLLPLKSCVIGICSFLKKKREKRRIKRFNCKLDDDLLAFIDEQAQICVKRLFGDTGPAQGAPLKKAPKNKNKRA